nr:hypothetical protein [Tanacetum cinerariifolium]
MVKSSLSLENEPCCSKSCKKNTDSLNSKITKLTDKLSDKENMLFHYKAGLAQVKARLAEHKNQELKYYETIIDYSRPSLAIESTSNDLQNKITSVTETGASDSTISSKPIIKFVKEAIRLTKNKTDKGETVKKPAVKYAKLYRKPSKGSKVRGNQRN